MPTPYRQAEGYTTAGVNRKSAGDPARPETLGMPGSLLHRTWEISSVPSGDRVGWGRHCRNPTIDADEKSDTTVVPGKRPNNGECPAEVVEGRGVVKGNAGETPTHRTQSRGCVSMGLDGVREAARRNRRVPTVGALG
jgi:hypothetical protein